MSRFRKTKKITGVILSVLLVASLAACGSPGGNTSTSSSTSGTSAVSTQAASTATEKTPITPITLKVWSTETEVAGIQKNAVADEITRLTGVTLDVVQGDAQKFKVLMAGNDLPDIIYTNDTSQGVSPDTLITSGQLMPLDSIIDEYGDNLKKNFVKRLEYSKKYLSSGQNKIYYIPILGYKADPDNPDISIPGYNIGLAVRWDIYANIGYPEIKTYDDLLDVLKKMQDSNPKTPDGKKVYAISGWSSWGVWPWYVGNLFEEGCTQLGDIYFDLITGKASVMYSEDRFWKSIKNTNKAYRMGLLDAEAFTMKYANFIEKATAGQVLMTYASWQADGINTAFVTAGHPDWGFEKIPIDGNPYIHAPIAPDAPLGYGQAFANAITRNCKNPERAIQFLDFMNSYDAARLCWSGVKGQQWDVVDGKPVPTEAFLDMKKNDKDYSVKTGVGTYNKFCGLANNQVCPDGYPADLALSNEQKAKDVKEIDKIYCKHFGDNYLFPGQVIADMLKQGKVKTHTKFWLSQFLVQPASDDSQKIMSQVDEYMKVAIVKIIMAKSDDEFEAEKQKAMKDIKAKGYEKAEADILEKFAKADQDAATFSVD